MGKKPHPEPRIPNFLKRRSLLLKNCLQYILGIGLLLMMTACGGKKIDVKPGEVFRNADGNWECRYERYTAVVDSKTGRLVSLTVKGQELLERASGGMMYAAGKPFSAALVPLESVDTVGAWDGNFGVWWHFLPDTLLFEYAVNKADDPALVFVFSDVVQAIGAEKPLAHRHMARFVKWHGWPDTDTGVELTTDSSRFGMKLHVQGLDPKALAEWNSRKAKALRVGFPQAKRCGGEIHFGPPIPADAAKATVGFHGPFYHLFPATGELQFTTTVKLEVGDARDLEVAALLMDYNTREIYAAPAQVITVRPGQAETLKWHVPWNRQGVFRGSVRARIPGQLIGEKAFTFAYDLAHWQPRLYRPGDFWEFWDEQLEALRAEPLDPKLELLEKESGPDFKVYKVEITGVNGRRIKGKYGEPTADGKFPLLLSTPHPGKDLEVKVEDLWVQVAGEMADVAKYRLNVGDITKSNFLHVYLDYVRWLDFAASRGKVDWNRVLAPAGSRGGPMVIAAAALDKRIKLITMNVGTCNRSDWQVNCTSGWGPYLTDRMPGQSAEEFIKVLAYSDPSHFAERVTIPVAASWGMLDGLSPINGQLSMWVNLKGPKFLELQPWGGHQGNTPGYGRLMSILRRKLFKGEPITADAGPLGVDWKKLLPR